MSKKTVSNEQLIRVKAKYEAKFGISLDMWSAMNLAMIDESFESLESKVEEANRTIKGASDKIKAEVKQYHFKNDSQAFYHGLGKFIPISLAIMVFSFVVYIIYTTTFGYDDRKAFMDKYDKALSYRTLIEKGELVQNGNTQYLVLRNNAKQRNVNLGKDGVYIRRNNTIYIPLKVKK